MRFFLFLPVILFLLWPVSGYAQNTALAGFTEKEKVGFAFYHLINRDPPYDDWTRGQADFKAAKPNVQLVMIDRQRARLAEGFASYAPDRDWITIKLPVKVVGGDNPDYGTDPEMQAANLTKKIDIDFMGSDESPYFPFQLGKLWIAMIPQGLEQRSTHYLTEEQFSAFCPKKTNNERGKCVKFNQNIDANIVLRPVSADAEKPLVLHDIPLWLMMSDLGAIIFLHRDGGLVWEYAMPWYQSQRSSALMQLYDR